MKTIKQQIEEWTEEKTNRIPLDSEYAQIVLGVARYDELMQALEEALEIVKDRDALDRNAFGTYYDDRNPLASQWLRKFGF